MRFAGLKKSTRALAVVVALAAATAAAVHIQSALARTAAVSDGVVQLLALAGVRSDMPFDEQVDRVRSFINTNSVHEVDDEFYSYWHDLPAVIGRMVGFASGAALPPHMECASRAELMQAVLEQLGFDTRTDVVYAPSDGYPSHTFLGVLNPATGQWQVQDPEFNVFWMRAGTGERASVNDLIAGELGAVVPCIAPGECGWAVETAEGKRVEKLRDYLGLAAIIDREKGLRPLLVNVGRFDIDHPHRAGGKEQPFCTYVAKACRQTITKWGHGHEGREAT